ncbi:putative glycoside hydrolase family 16 protein, partial [Dendrothele bispora CBS 962.96]
LSLAIPLPSEPKQPAKRQDQAAAQGATWTLADKYEGQNFFKGWNFYSDPDPTHGFVKYEAQSAAMDQKLAVIDESGVVTLSVDAKTKPPEGVQAFNRSAVRITTKKRYNGGLFIANFSMMPVGCSTWPAYWMTEGTHWPDTGELDILEGVNGSPPNKITAHTGAGCSLQVNADAISGTPPASMPQTCENQPGCGVGDTTPSSFGPEFNQAGGGILVHRWTSTKIEVWHFKQGDAPQDIANGKPNPDSWGKPQFLLGGDQCVIKDLFVDNSLIINTSLCGDWAGGAWEQSSCNKKADGTPRTCQEAVADPTLTFSDAKWKINFIHVYQSS